MEQDSVPDSREVDKYVVGDAGSRDSGRRLPGSGRAEDKPDDKGRKSVPCPDPQTIEEDVMDDDARATARAKVVAIVRQYAPTLVVVLPPVRRRESLLAAEDEKASESVRCWPSWAQWRRPKKGKFSQGRLSSSALTSSAVIQR